MRGHSLHCIRFLTLLSAALLTAIAVVRAFNYPPSLNGGMFVQQNHASTTTTAEFKGKHARQCLLIMRSRPFGSQSSSRNVSDRYPRHPQQVMPESTPTTPSADEPISRSRAIGVGLSAWIGGLTLASGASQALDPVRKAQEMMRIWNQEEADNVLGGGELASPEGGKTLQPVLALIPIVTLRLQLDEIERSLKDPRQFGDALAILQTQDFQKKDIKRVFNAYSDNIYYLPESERENKYLQGGATPSSRQTIQYLLRNEVIDNVEALTAEVAYLVREREALTKDGGINVSGGGSAADSPDLDEKDLKLYLGRCQGSFDRYLGMVLQNEIDEATEYAKMALAAKKKGGNAQA